jgi:hypothetical protein
MEKIRALRVPRELEVGEMKKKRMKRYCVSPAMSGLEKITFRRVAGRGQRRGGGGRLASE